MAAEADAEALAGLTAFGEDIGLAFQIADDVLDVTSTTDELGKTAGRDAELKKSTYPALLGLDGARARADRLCDDACLALREAGIHSPQLESLARFVVDRRS
jgi:geranylgeranyl pyrophosphate synthase